MFDIYGEDDNENTEELNCGTSNVGTAENGVSDPENE